MEDIRLLLERIRHLHANIAADVYPNGGVLECNVCHARAPFSVQDAARYLATGWPTHCGQSMKFSNEAEKSASEKD